MNIDTKKAAKEIIERYGFNGIYEDSEHRVDVVDYFIDELGVNLVNKP